MTPKQQPLAKRKMPTAQNASKCHYNTRNGWWVSTGGGGGGGGRWKVEGGRKEGGGQRRVVGGGRERERKRERERETNGTDWCIQSSGLKWLCSRLLAPLGEAFGLAGWWVVGAR